MKDYYIVRKDEITGKNLYVYDIFNEFENETGEDIGFNRGNAIKYITRYNRKTACGLYDLEKAQDYLELCCRKQTEIECLLAVCKIGFVQNHYAEKDVCKTTNFVSDKCNELKPIQKALINEVLRGEYLQAIKEINNLIFDEKLYSEEPE